MLWLTIGSGRGGMEQAMQRIAARVDLGGKVTVLPPMERRSDWLRLAAHARHVVQDAQRSIPSAVLKVHTFGGSPSILVYALRRFGWINGIDHIVWIRNAMVELGAGGKYRAVIRAAAAAERCAVLTVEAQRELALHGIEAQLVPNWVEGVRRTPHARDSANRYGPIVWASRLAPAKDPFLLLRAYEKVKIPNRLIIAGSGEYAEEIARRITGSRRRQDIDLVGHVSNVERLLDRASLHVLLSRFDGNPNALLEGYRSATPTMANAVEGTRHTLGYGKYGHLLSMDPSPEEVTTAIDALISDRDTWAELSDRAAEGAAHYSWHARSSDYAWLTLAKADRDGIADG